MGFVSEFWAVVGSLSGGKRKASSEDAQHASPAKRSKQSTPTDVSKEQIRSPNLISEQKAAAQEALPPVVVHQHESLPKPFKPLLQQPDATAAVDRRRRRPLQNAFKQFSHQQTSPLAQLGSVNGQPRVSEQSNRMLFRTVWYFQHGCWKNLSMQLIQHDSNMFCCKYELPNRI